MTRSKQLSKKQRRNVRVHTIFVLSHISPHNCTEHKAHSQSKRRAASSTGKSTLNYSTFTLITRILILLSVDPIKIWATQRHNHENEAAEDNIGTFA